MHISFDFDYTLADSSEGSVVCANFAFRELGMPELPAAAIRKTIGLSLEKTFEALVGSPATSVPAERFKQLFLAHANEVMLRHIYLYEGTRHALEILKENGHYISIVSTKRKERIEEAIIRDGLDHCIDDVIGGGCVQRNKPDPEGLELAMGKTGLPRHETIYIGDSVSDGECAHRAKVGFVGLLSGQTSRAELLKWQPLGLLHNIDEVPGLVASL